MINLLTEIKEVEPQPIATTSLVVNEVDTFLWPTAFRMNTKVVFQIPHCIIGRHPEIKVTAKY